MKTKTFEFTIKKKCSHCESCSDEIIEKLKPLGLKLRADNDHDSVNGYLSMIHENNNHRIIIGIYEDNENPNWEHTTKLIKPTKFPSENQIGKLLK